MVVMIIFTICCLLALYTLNEYIKKDVDEVTSDYMAYLEKEYKHED